MLDLYLCSVDPRIAMAIWIVTGILGLVVSFFLKGKLNSSLINMNRGFKKNAVG